MTSTPTAAPLTPLDEDALVRANVPLVQYAVTAVSNRVPRHVSRDDLVSAGMLGLAQAARGYDPARGIPFKAFAMIRIRGALIDELRSRDWATRSVRSSARRMDAANDAFTNRNGRTPSLEETATEMGTDITTVQSLVDDIHRGTVLSYESLTLDGPASGILRDQNPTPVEHLLDRERKAYLTDAIVALPDRLRHVVVSYFYDERPMQDIARELGVTESRISQMRGEALALLGAGITANLDPELLPAEPAPASRVARKRAEYYAAIAGASTTAGRVSAPSGAAASAARCRTAVDDAAGQQAALAESAATTAARSQAAMTRAAMRGAGADIGLSTASDVA